MLSPTKIRQNIMQAFAFIRTLAGETSLMTNSGELENFYVNELMNYLILSWSLCFVMYYLIDSQHIQSTHIW